MSEQLALDAASGPVHPETAATLRLVAGDPRHERDRERIVATILAVAAEHGWLVDPNHVRRRLSHPAGGLLVDPRVVGATYNALTRAGVLVHDGWVENDDVHGGNKGKPARRYRLVRAALREAS